MNIKCKKCNSNLLDLNDKVQPKIINKEYFYFHKSNINYLFTYFILDEKKVIMKEGILKYSVFNKIICSQCSLNIGYLIIANNISKVNLLDNIILCKNDIIIKKTNQTNKNPTKKELLDTNKLDEIYNIVKKIKNQINLNKLMINDVYKWVQLKNLKIN